MSYRALMTQFRGFIAVLSAVVTSVATSVTPASGDEGVAQVVEGFVVCERFTRDPETESIEGLALTPEGDPILLENNEVAIHHADSVESLMTFETPVFGSFLVVGPNNDAVYVGESTDGNIYRVPLAGGEQVLVDNIRFNYALDIDGDGRGAVSAPNSDFTLNQIVLLDGEPGLPSPVLVDSIPGFSGPLAFDDDGNLYYGTGEADCSETLVRFTKEQIDLATSGIPLDFERDAEVLLTDLFSVNNMVFADGNIYFSDLGFCSLPAVGTVRKVDIAENFLTTPFAEFPINPGVLSPTIVAFRPGSRAFERGAGPEGGSLLVTVSNFVDRALVAEVTSELHFVRGRINRGESIDISDAISLLNFLFNSGTPPSPLEAGNINRDEMIDVSDVIYLLNFLFVGGPSIPPPFPEPGPAS